MAAIATTRVSLLVRLRDLRDAEAWSQFVHIYGPLVYHYALRRGLQDADAADVVQEVLREVARSVERFEYDPRLGRFRNWLLTVARRVVTRLTRKPARRLTTVGDSTGRLVLENLPAEDEEAFWDEQYRREAFNWAAEQVRRDVHETTWQAFWLTAVEGVKPQDVAKRLGVSVGSVYVSKNRVVRRLKQLIQSIDESF